MHKTLQFFLHGYVFMQSVYIGTERELSRFVPKALIRRVKSYTQQYRQHLEDQTEGLYYQHHNNPGDNPAGLYYFEPNPDVSKDTETKHYKYLETVFYNPQALGDNLDFIFQELNSPHILCMGGHKDLVKAKK